MFAIYDTETNGLPDGNDFSKVYMTQIAIIITDGNKNYEEVEYMINGDFEISQEITDITGITKQMTIDNGISFANAWKTINKLLEKHNCKYIIAHNNRFDNAVIKQEYKRLHNIKDMNIKENPHQEEINRLIRHIEDYNILSSRFINKIKYNLRMLRAINSFLIFNSDKNIEYITKYIFNIYNDIKSKNKLFGDKFFQLVPIDSLNDIFRKEITVPSVNEIRSKLKQENIKGLSKLNKTDLLELFYDWFDIEESKYFIENHKLETIYNYLHEKPYIQKHTALDDCWVLQKALSKINYNISNYVCL